MSDLGINCSPIKALLLMFIKETKTELPGNTKSIFVNNKFLM